jgi:hypothetical protein
MKSPLRRAWLGALLLLGLSSGLRAQLVAPPSFTSISLPSTATVGQNITVSATGVANYSDNSDNNDWNTGDHLRILRVMVWYFRPGDADWTLWNDWMPSWVSPNTFSNSINMNVSGTWYFWFDLMDGRPWYHGGTQYSVTVSPPPGPVINSALSLTRNQGQAPSYTITATNSPTSFGATSLPGGLGLNTSSGAITGTLSTNSGAVTGNTTVNSTITATNGNGTDQKTLAWTIIGATFTGSPSVSPSPQDTGLSVTLSYSASANFGVSWVERVIWRPNGTAYNAGNTTGTSNSFSWTPDDADGTYTYQIRVVDPYYNYRDFVSSFTLQGPTAPPNLQSTTAGSDFVDLSWGASASRAGLNSSNKYKVYRDGVQVGTSNTTTFRDTTAQPGRAYVYTVKAVDVNDKHSLAATVNVTTAGAFELFTPRL